VTEPDSARLAALEAQVAALTRRVYQLETGQAPPAPGITPLLNEQPAELVDSPQPAPVAEPPPQPTDWEATIGANWLNRAGILLLVIGITLFLGFAMTTMGPAGRIATGAAAGLALLAGGYWFQRDEKYQTFSLGLLAGGFAVLYATAYAAHAVEASRIIHSPVAGALLQTLIALAAVAQAVRLNSEKAAGLALLGAFIGLSNAPDMPIIYGGVYPLTLASLWLSFRLGWQSLPWSVLLYTWATELGVGSQDWEFESIGRPVAWVNLVLFAGYEILWRRREAWSWWHPLWTATNVTFLVFVTFYDSRFTGSAHVESIWGLLTIFGLCFSLARRALEVRHEALSEALTVIAAYVYLIQRMDNRDPLLLLMLGLALALLALWVNRREPTIALTVTGEALLALISLAMLVTFGEQKPYITSPLRIRLALPQTLTLTAALFAAGRWLTTYPWPSWAALVSLAVVTLGTFPQTLGTIVLAIEAILAVAAGLYLNRRPIRLGGIALFLFSIGKVFVFDLSELDTLPRIFSFIVLGLLLIGASWAYSRYREQLQKYL
jgi:uncharacterized membrane protein